MKRKRPHILMALLVTAMGLFIVAVSLNVIRPDPDSVHAPRWVLFLAGLIFVAGGIALIVPKNTVWQQMAAATIVISMALVAGWITLFGSGDHMSGGFWFLSPDMNVFVGRVVFGLASLMCFAIAGWAIFGKREQPRGRE